MKRLELEAMEKNKLLHIEEQKVAMAAEERREKRVTEDYSIMFMDRNNMDEKVRRYWELTRVHIMAKMFGGDGAGSGSGGADGEGGGS